MARASVESRGGEDNLPVDGSADVYALDPSSLDPNKHYRWVAPRNYARRVRQGYGAIRRSNSGVRFLHEDLLLVQQSADDLFHKGESFLMACDKKLYRERRKRIEQIAEGRLESPEKRFKKKAAQEGVEAFGDNKYKRGEPDE